MGWKLAAIVSRLEGRTLQSLVAEVYGAPHALQATTIPASEALNPRERDRFALGHDGFGWIFDWELASRSFREPLQVQRHASTFVLHSVTGLYGYSTHSDRKILRRRSGASDDGIHIDEGEPSDAELALVMAGAVDGQAAWNAWCSGAETFSDDDDILDTVSGEEVVFGLIDALTGIRIDGPTPQSEAFHAALVQQIVPPAGFLARILGWR